MRRAGLLLAVLVTWLAVGTLAPPAPRAQPVAASRSPRVGYLGPGPGATLAATRATERVPIVMMDVGDPVAYQRVVDFALRHRLATLFGWREFVDAGGLMAYGPSVTALYRQTAGYVARVVRGARPGDLPVQPPERYELTINLRTARAIGVRIPDSVVTRADALID